MARFEPLLEGDGAQTPPRLTERAFFGVPSLLPEVPAFLFSLSYLSLLPLRTLRVGLGSHELGTPKSLRPRPDCRISFQGLLELVGFEIVAKCSLKKPCYVATIEDPVRVDVHVDTAVEFAGEYPGWIYGGVHACGAVHTSVKAICNFAKYPAHGHRDLALVEQHRLGAHKA